MKYAFYIVFFLALALSVISAPAPPKNPKAVSNAGNSAPKKGNSGSNAVKSSSKNSKNSQNSKAPPSGKGKKRGLCKRAQAALDAKKKAAGSKPARPNKGAGAQGAKAPAGGRKTGKVRRNFNFSVNTTASDIDIDLFRRARETSLCGMNIRGGSSGMCRGNPAYLFSLQTRTSHWNPWDTIRDRMTSSNIPSKYQCDHALELQLTVKALTDHGFCKALDEMARAWKKIDPRKDVQEAIRQEFFRAGGLKPTANAPTMLFFVDTRFNEIKRAFTAAYLRASPQQTTDQLKNYFHSGVTGIVDGIAPAIDSAAYALLEKINVMATPSNYDEMTASEELQNLVCALDTAQTVTFESWERPVTGYWNGMKEAVHGTQ